MRNIALNCFLISLSFLSACSRSKPVATPPSSDPKKDLKNAEVSKDKAAFESNHLPPLKYDVSEYRVSARIERGEDPVMIAQVDMDLQLIDASEDLVLNANLKSIDLVSSGDHPLQYLFDAQAGLLTIHFGSLQKAGSTQQIHISYSAVTSDSQGGVFAYKPAADKDPLAVPVIFTSSEPRRLRYWIPSQDRPDDRARFQLRFNMAPNEKLIANGLLTLDTVDVGSGRHVMEYRTNYALPTYIMAFAIGDFQVEKREWRGKEISIWSRSGLPLDAKSLLDETEHQLDFYSDRLGLYPWEKYAVVLLPDFDGGMENASITFNEESHSSVADHMGDRSLMAHELGHQWFGDWVTVESWDDLWIKEGMATFLSAEVFRGDQLTQAQPRYTGNLFYFKAGDAIDDPALKPDAKYTTGPYDRAAWFIDQLRASIGDEKFWPILKGLLVKHALGTLNSTQFLDAFEGTLSPQLLARARAALFAKTLPELHVSAVSDGSFSLSVRDPDQALLLPLDFSILNLNQKSRTRVELGAFSKISAYEVTALQPGQVLAFDSKDVHPELSNFLVYSDQLPPVEKTKIWEILSSSIVPKAPSDFRPWIEQSFDAEKYEAFTFGNAENWSQLSHSDEWSAIYQSARSPQTRGAALNLGCALLTAGLVTDQEFMNEMLKEKLGAFSLVDFPWTAAEMQGCGPLAKVYFSDYWKLMMDHPESTLLGDRNVAYLSYFVPLQSDTEILAAWVHLSKTGQTMRVRQMASKVLMSVTKQSE